SKGWDAQVVHAVPARARRHHRGPGRWRRPARRARVSAWTGRESSPACTRDGMLVRCWPGSVPVLADGKHRLLAAWELALPALWGRVWTPRGDIVWTGQLCLR